MKNVFIVIEATSVDYHGRYEEIIGVYADLTEAQVVCDELNSARKYNVEYWISEWSVKEKANEGNN